MSIRHVVALIPARAGSKRIVGKNLRPLRGHPLLAYAVTAARSCGIFDDVVVSTEDERTAEVAAHYGASVPFLRPVEMSGDRSSHIDWVRHALKQLSSTRAVDAFALLRPTSPLRRPSTISAAVSALLADEEADSLRAVEPVTQHPGKMWIMKDGGRRMSPLLDDGGAVPPWHSSPYQALPVVHVQNASLEVAWARTVERHSTIAGHVVRPWLSEGLDGYDLNDERDWILLERLLDDGTATLPELPEPGPSAAPLTDPTDPTDPER